LTVLFSAALVVALPSPAEAHPDFPVVDRTLEVGAGGFAAFPLRAHFHRLVGGFEVIAPTGAAVTTLLMDAEAFGAYAAGRPAPYLYSSGSSAGAKVNALIACCHRFDVVFSQQYDQELTYTPYHLVIDNRDSASPATVRLRATLVHDGVAILVYGGEPFALGPVGAVLGLIGALLSRSVLRALRGGKPPAGGAGASRRSLVLAGLASLALYVAAAAAILSIALAASAAYGGGLLEGLVASQGAENPDTTEWYEFSFPFRSGRYDALALAVPLAWVLAIVLWSRAFAPALRERLRLVGAIGVLEGAGPLLLAGLVALSYGAPIVPILGGAIVGLPQIIGGLALIRSSPRRRDDEAVARDSAHVTKSEDG
jgi:hypothetical protein